MPIPRHASPAERFLYGTGVDANLLVKVKDRAGVVTKYEYDASGRRTKTIQSYATMDLADAETLITDPALRVEEVCTYVRALSQILFSPHSYHPSPHFWKKFKQCSAEVSSSS